MSTNELSTIVLRFRDLGLDRGETILRHREVIDKGGSVWWGWWHKGGETIPDEAFRQLNVLARSGGLTAYLLDSGQNVLYSAKCTKINWESDHAEFESPDIALTPVYYNKQKYLAWFRLVEIKEVNDPEDQLHKLSYVRVDEFFDGKQSNYLPFYGKQVRSVNELVQQNRTIWFLRPFRSGDPTHEVSLLNARAVNPVHFYDEFYQSDSATLLWLSDTHFSIEGHHGFPLKTTPAAGSNLAARLTSEFRKTHSKLAGLILSGDITWKALPEEFDLAMEFKRELGFWSHLESDQVAICPGNHDLKFSLDPADKTNPIDAVGDEYRSAYSNFYEQLFFVAPNEFLSSGRRLLLANAIPVEIVCLNSSYLQQLKGAFQGHGFIGEQQLDHVAQEMTWDADSTKPRPFRIVVLHHHLLPTTYRAAPHADYPYSVVLDAEALSRWVVEYRVDLVLHGHMHQPFTARISRPVQVLSPLKEWHEFSVIGMGSSGVKGELGEVNKNTVGFLEFKTTGLMVSVYSVHPTDESQLLWQVEVPYPKTKT